MGLSALLNAAANTAFTIAGDTRKEVTVYTSPTFAHDTETDQTATTWGASKTVQALLYDAKEKKQADNPETTRRACLLKGSDFTGLTITQEAEVQAEGFRWKVESVSIDPAGATIELQLYR